MTARRQVVNVALVVLALVAVAAVLVTRDHVTTAEKDAREQNLLGAFREDEVSRVEFELEGRRTVLERSGEAGRDAEGERSFRLREPVQEEADAYGTDKLLGTLEFARVLRRIKPEEVRRDAFGLDAPRAGLTLQMGRIRYEVKFGREAPAPPGAVYAEVGGEAVPAPGVVLVPGDLLAELKLAEGDLRNRQLTPYLSTSLAKLALSGMGGERPLRRDGKVFRFDGVEGERRVARDALDRILLQLARLRVERFLPVADAERIQTGTEVVRLELTPSDAGKPRGVLVVGGACADGKPGVVARRAEPDPLAGCVPESVLPGLHTPREELVDRTPSALRRDEVESVELEVRGRKLVLDRKETGYLLREPRKSDVELEAGDARIDALIDAPGTLVEAPDLRALGLEPPEGRLTLRSAAADDADVTVEQILIGRAGADGRLPLRREQDGAVLLLEREAARAFRPDAALVRSRKVLSFRGADATWIESVAGAVRQRVVRDASGLYRFEVPQGFEPDGALVADAVDALAALEADRWVADDDDGSFGLRPAWLTVEVAWKEDGGARTAKLSVGGAASGGFHAALAGDPGVFVLPRRAVEALDRLWLDRAGFLLAPTATTRLTLVAAGGRRLVLARSGGELLRVEGLEIGDDRRRRLLDALTELRAEGAVHLGAPRPAEGLDAPVLTVRIEREAAVGPPVEYRIGAGDTWRGTSIHYGRIEGQNATWALARSRVAAVLDLLD